MNGQSEDAPTPTADNREEVTGPFRVLPPALDPVNEVLWSPDQALEPELPTQGGRTLYHP